jgi:hypothetical protein
MRHFIQASWNHHPKPDTLSVSRVWSNGGGEDVIDDPAGRRAAAERRFPGRRRGPRWHRGETSRRVGQKDANATSPSPPGTRAALGRVQSPNRNQNLLFPICE